MMRVPTFVLLSTLTSSAMAMASSGRLPFVADDFAGAQARARSGKLPLFVEVGAPW
jgi:hypothetical protein